MAYFRKLNNCKNILKAKKCPRFRSDVKQCVFIWSIEHFSMAVQNEDEELDSPEFCTSESIPAKFLITIYPKGKAENEEYIGVILYRASKDTASEVVNAGSWLSIVDADGKLCNLHKSKCFYRRNDGLGYPAFIRIEELFEKKTKYLPNDTLTLRCEISIDVGNNESEERNTNENEVESSMYESLSGDLKKLYDSANYSDLTLKLGDEELKFHKVILAARCSMLANVFETERLKHEINHVDLANVDPDAMKAFISYLYTGKVHSGTYVPLGLYDVACKYKLRELQHLCTPNKLHARTKINVKKCCYTWVIENFSHLTHSIGEKVLTASFLPYGRNFDLLLQPKCPGGGDEDVSVSLFRPWCAKEESALRVKFKVSVLDINNELQHSAELNEMFGTGESFGFRPFIKRDILFKERRNLLPNDILTLQCDISVADGTFELSDIKEVFLIETSAGYNDNHFRKLGEDLKYFYDSKQLTDITIQVKHHKFYVHKVILIARSPVFSGMFSHEMAEKRTNVVEISDIEPHIVRIMLQYIYSGQLEGVNMDNIIELYSASDKYQLLDMKAKCFAYLSGSFTYDNVCDVLILADMHSDNKLKLAAKKYFSSHACHVMETSKWQDILKNKFSLASEVLQFHDTYSGTLVRLSNELNTIKIG